MWSPKSSCQFLDLSLGMENAIMDINMAACDSERKPLPTAANSEPSRPASTVESGSRENFDQIIWNLYLAWISSDNFESLLLEEKTTRSNRMKFRLPSIRVYIKKKNYYFLLISEHPKASWSPWRNAMHFKHLFAMSTFVCIYFLQRVIIY